MRILVGLGNPGEKYKRHRHNVGFMAVDRIHEVYGFSPWKEKFGAAVAEGFLDGAHGREKILLLKPQTYMNESGQAVGEAMRFYKLAPEDIVVFYDELDLAPGKVRVKRGGGAAGHNGIRSLCAHIGPDFERVRIGIGHPGDKSRVTGHVLGDFAKADRAWLTPLLDALARAAPHLAAGAPDKFQTEVARLAPAPGAKLQRPPGGGEGDARAAEKAAPARSAAAKVPSTDDPAAEKSEGKPEGPLAGVLKRLFDR